MNIYKGSFKGIWRKEQRDYIGASFKHSMECPLVTHGIYYMILYELLELLKKCNHLTLLMKNLPFIQIGIYIIIFILVL